MVGARSTKGVADERVGRPLASARRRQRLTLSQASSQLNIPVRQLQALEQGDFSLFAAEVYARGAYRQYARFLGVYTERAERAALRTLSAVRERIPLRLHTPLTWFQRMATPRVIFVAVLGCIGLLVGSYIGWQVWAFLVVPSLTVSQPVSGVVDGTTLVVQGKAEPDSHVMVNGETVLLREEGAFELPISLHPGINVLRVEAENAAGRMRVIERDIVAPPVPTR